MPALPEFHYRLGDRVVDVTRRTLVMGILNRTPDSFFDRGATYELDNLLHKAEQLVEQGADILDVGGVKAGPGPGGGGGRGARPRRRSHRGVGAALRRRHLVRHVAGVGARRRVCSRRGDRQRHLRLRRPRLPARRGEARRVGGGHAHPARSRASPTPTRTTTTWSATSPSSCSTARTRPRPRASPATRSRSTPGSTSASRSRRARCCCARATPSPRTATRCCSPRPTSGSSAWCSASSSRSGGPRRSRRWPTA